MEWLLDEAPSLHVSLYIGATGTYEDLAEATADPVQQLAYQERVMEVYDKRIEYFGNEGEVLNRKAFAAYKFFKNNKAKYPELIELFAKANRLNGIDAFDNNLVAFMDIIRRYKLSGGEISDKEVLDYYYELGDIIDKKIEAGQGDGVIKGGEIIDQIIVEIVKLDCNEIEKTFGPKMQQDPTNIKAAKKLFHQLLTGKCTDSPLFYESAKVIQESEPTYGIARILAARRAAEGDYESALGYYSQALDLTDENSKKAETLVDMAKVYSTRGEKSLAKGHAVKAIGYDQNLTEAYNLIGNLYYHSYEDCKEGVSRVKDRAVFIAAYDMYRKAGNARGMEEAKNQFPSIGEIFEEGMQEGDKIALSCWVKESVVLQKR